MGLPVMNIIFETAARDSVRRSQRGTVGMIVKDTIPTVNPVVIYKEKDIHTTLSEDTKEQVMLAMKGYVTKPSKIVVYVLAEEETDYGEALDYFAIKKVNWLCCPSVETDELTDEVVEWVEKQRKERNKVKAVLPVSTANNEGIVNYATTSVTVGEKTYTSEEYCSRIAGLLAGTPKDQGSTYAVLEDVTECTAQTKQEADTAIDAGKFVLFYDGEKVKVARGVNSLTTTDETKNEAWKKIVVVETMDMMHDDLVLLVEDNYIGKYRNTFDNKCLLLSAVQAYFNEIAKSGLIESYSVGFDTEKIKEYIIENKGVSKETAESMSEEELKKQYTDEKVFMYAAVTIVDVMEDITLNIAV